MFYLKKNSKYHLMIMMHVQLPALIEGTVWKDVYRVTQKLDNAVCNFVVTNGYYFGYLCKAD